MSRSLGQDVENAANSVIEALVKRMFEIHERLKQKESEFIQIHDAVVNEMESNIIKQYENQRFSIDGEKGIFELKELQNEKVIFKNDEKSISIDLDKLDSIVKPIVPDKVNGFIEDKLENIKESQKIFENSEIGLSKKEPELVKAKNINAEVSKTLEKNVVKTISDTKVDIKTPFLVTSQIRGQLEVLNYLKSLSDKEVLKNFKDAQKQAKIEDKPIDQVYKEKLQERVNSHIQASRERVLDTAINTYEKNQELRNDLRFIESEINKNIGVLYQAKLEQKISPDEFEKLKDNLNEQKCQIEDRILKINQSDKMINEQLKVDLKQQFPDLKTEKLSLNESIGLASAAYSMTNDKTIGNLRNLSLKNELKGIINSIDKSTKEVEFEIQEITEVTFSR
ncbi:MAG: hypothetical protein WAM95_21490 [Bacillus sp. (in: firmicutes)]